MLLAFFRFQPDAANAYTRTDDVHCSPLGVHLRVVGTTRAETSNVQGRLVVGVVEACGRLSSTFNSQVAAVICLFSGVDVSLHEISLGGSAGIYAFRGCMPINSSGSTAEFERSPTALPSSKPHILFLAITQVGSHDGNDTVQSQRHYYCGGRVRSYASIDPQSTRHTPPSLTRYSTKLRHPP